MVIAKYVLQKDLPNLKAGSIFEHREYDPEHPDRGNCGCGAMVLGWVNGNCQDGWCGETYVFPGQLADNEEWFVKMSDVMAAIVTSSSCNKNRYAVSLVYSKEYISSSQTKMSYSLRTLITDAMSEAEALGMAIMHFQKEKKEWSLFMHTVVAVFEEQKKVDESV